MSEVAHAEGIQSLPPIGDPQYPISYAPIQILESIPDSVKFHLVLDQELNDLVNIGHPTKFGFASLLLGSFIGLLPSVFDAFAHLGTNKFEPKDLWLALAATACLFPGLVLAFMSASTAQRARSVVREIRARKTQPRETHSKRRSRRD